MAIWNSKMRLSCRTCAFLLAMVAAAGLAQAEAEISGTVIDVTGAVIPGVPIQLHGPDSTREERSSELGRFVFRSVPSGQYRLVLTSPGFYPKPMQITLTDAEALRLGNIEMQVVAYFWETPTLNFLAGNPLRGNIVSTLVVGDGRALSGARVALTCPTKSPCEVVFTGPDGKARFEGYEAGRYRLIISAQGYYSQDLELQILAGVELDYGRVLLEECQEPTCDPAKRIWPVTL